MLNVIVEGLKYVKENPNQRRHDHPSNDRNSLAYIR